MNYERKVEILLVEDNSNDAELILHILKKHNPKNCVIHVTDGEEALDYFFCRGEFAYKKDNDNLKMVILDLNLPKVNGMDVLKTMKANQQTKSIPVVVLTSSRAEKDIIEGYELGVSSYIMKSDILNSSWEINEGQK